MYSSPTVSVVFTIVFAATGGYALYRLATHVTKADPTIDRTAELAHLLMSVAMVAMAWGCTGGPDSASGIVQLVVFGLFGGSFLIAALGGSLGSGLHLLTAVAMVWMVAAMPQLMGVAGAAEDGSSMAGMPGMGDMSGSMPAGAAPGTPTWMTVLSVVFAVLLLVAAGLWIRDAVAGAVRSDGPDTTDARQDGRHAAVATAPRRAVRLDAACHALMCLGMGAALVAML